LGAPSHEEWIGTDNERAYLFFNCRCKRRIDFTTRARLEDEKGPPSAAGGRFFAFYLDIRCWRFWIYKNRGISDSRIEII
jgi:hypothetical protein